MKAFFILNRFLREEDVHDVHKETIHNTTSRHPRKRPEGHAQNKTSSACKRKIASVSVPMDTKRMALVLKLMSKHSNFGPGVNMDDPQTMVNHFACLMILNEAYKKNGQGKADRYPRYFRVLVGKDGCFTHHHQIRASNESIAREFLTKYVNEVKIHTQTIKIDSVRVPAMQAPEHMRRRLTNKLINDFMHGFNEYVKVLELVKSGKLTLPDNNNVNR